MFAVFARDGIKRFSLLLPQYILRFSENMPQCLERFLFNFNVTVVASHKILFMGSVTPRTYQTTAKPAVDSSFTEVSRKEVTSLQQLRRKAFR